AHARRRRDPRAARRARRSRHDPASALRPRTRPLPGGDPMTRSARSSRLPGFYKLSMDARRREIGRQCGFDAERLAHPLLDEATANHMVENVISVYGLPLGVALNFQINGRDVLVPMCVEEPSVIAAASNAAKMIR